MGASAAVIRPLQRHQLELRHYKSDGRPEEDESVTIGELIKNHEIAFKWQGEREHDGHPEEILRMA